MKLRHTLAGTVALPLALAVASANAATVFDDERGKLQVGGYISGIATWDWDKVDESGMDSDVDFDIGLGTSRLNLTYTNDAGVTLLYENDFRGVEENNGTGYRLRHAAVSYNGLVAGQTWSGFANLTGLGETIDAAGTASSASWANRSAVVGYNAPIADGMTVGLYLEDQTIGSDKVERENNTAIPDITANFKGDFGMVDVFFGIRMLQLDDNTPENGTEAKLDFALGVSADVTEQLNIKFAATSYDDAEDLDDDGKRSAEGRDLALALAAGFKVNEQIRTNLVIERIQADDKEANSTAFWLNGFYTLDSGLELGAELEYTSADDSAKKDDKDMTFRLQAKYAF